jgi:hypothetical protein
MNETARFKDKKGMPVLPNTRTLEAHASEYLLKLTKTKTDRVKKDLDLEGETDFEILQAAAARFGKETPEEFLKTFDKLLNVSSRLHEDTVYVIPSKDHDGYGFVGLQLADDLEYLEGDKWTSCELVSTALDDQGEIEVLDFEKEEFKKVRPWFIRRPKKE